MPAGKLAQESDQFHGWRLEAVSTCAVSAPSIESARLSDMGETCLYERCAASRLSPNDEPLKKHAM